MKNPFGKRRQPAPPKQVEQDLKALAQKIKDLQPGLYGIIVVVTPDRADSVCFDLPTLEKVINQQLVIDSEGISEKEADHGIHPR